MNETNRIIKNYEYRIESTPKYIQDVEDIWELVDVFIKYLPNKCVNYVTIFRRQTNNG